MKYTTFDLFPEDGAELPLEVLIARAKASVTALFLQQSPVVVAFSGGRDSGITASLVLDAARAFVIEHHRPATVVVNRPGTSDTTGLRKGRLKDHG